MPQTPLLKPLVVSVTQCAAMLGLSRAKIYLLVHEGILPLLKVGGTSKIPVAAIEEYVANCPVGVGEFPKKKSGASPIESPPQPVESVSTSSV